MKMANLCGQVGELTLQVQITRKETGKVEEYTLTAPIDAEQEKQLFKETDNGRNSLDSK
jgi:hypothetical protein